MSRLLVLVVVVTLLGGCLSGGAPAATPPPEPAPPIKKAPPEFPAFKLHFSKPPATSWQAPTGSDVVRTPIAQQTPFSFSTIRWSGAAQNATVVDTVVVHLVVEVTQPTLNPSGGVPTPIIVFGGCGFYVRLQVKGTHAGCDGTTHFLLEKGRYELAITVTLRQNLKLTTGTKIDLDLDARPMSPAANPTVFVLSGAAGADSYIEFFEAVPEP